MDNLEEQIHNDLRQYLLSVKEIDARLPECPDVEGKWETLQLFAGVVGLNRLCDNRAGGVASLVVLTLRGNRPCHVARTQPKRNRNACHDRR